MRARKKKDVLLFLTSIVSRGQVDILSHQNNGCLVFTSAGNYLLENSNFKTTSIYKTSNNHDAMTHAQLRLLCKSLASPRKVASKEDR